MPALAWSLHAADAALRKQLVPTAVDSPEALRDGLRATLAALPPRRRKVMVEYVLLGGCNDRPADADDLAAFLRPIEAACADPARASRRTGVLVNLIPFNPTPGSKFERPGWDAIDAFQARLREQGIWVSVRATRGADEGSACGQLWAQQPVKSRRVRVRAPAPAMTLNDDEWRSCLQCQGAGTIPHRRQRSIALRCPSCLGAGIVSGTAAAAADEDVNDVAVVGGGPAGLALALALQQRGMSSAVYERDAHFHARRPGYGLTISRAARRSRRSASPTPSPPRVQRAAGT